MRIAARLQASPLGLFRSSSTVALDIGPDAVVALEYAGGEHGRVRRAIVHPLPVGLVVDGEVADAHELAVELRALFGEHALARDVRVALAHPRLMVRMVELPASLSGSDLDGAVRHLAGDLLPVALDQLVLDYRRAGDAPPTGDVAQQRILIAAARADGLERLTTALDAAGLRAQRIQLAGVALLSALDPLPLRGPAVLYVQAGALTNVVIAEDGEPVLVRAASAGSEAIAAGLSERAGISHEAARRHVAALGLEKHAPLGPIIDDELEQAVTQQVREGLRRVVAEIQSSREFYTARPDARPIGAVVLTGTMTTWPGVAAALEAQLRVPLAPAGRDRWPDVGAAGIAPERLDVAVGLALAPADERPDLRPGHQRHGRRVTGSQRLAPVVCAVLAVLAAAIVYLVAISNEVSAGRERLGRIVPEVTAAEREASALKPYADFDAATLARREAVSTIASGRFDWERSLRQLAQVTPRDVWLDSVRATLAPTTQINGGAGAGTTSALRVALPEPALELAGCASTEGRVPAYMDRLQAMSAVSAVGFSRAERVGSSAKSSAAASGGGGDCGAGAKRASSFSIVTYFKATAAQAAAAATSAAAGAPTATATPSAPASSPSQGDRAKSTPGATSTTPATP